jgi:mono/diheme cytochrome c family protein
MSPRRTLAVVLIGAGACGAWLGDRPAAEAASPDPEGGRAVFARKQCTRCHAPRGTPGAGPPLEELRRPQGAMELAGRLWNHVPGMSVALVQGGLDWPRFSVAEMSDLMAYLQAEAARDAAPTPGKGHVTLLKKQCLKCHSFQREGGRIQPDLANRRPEYESATAWAVAMWTHTPRMAEMASRQQILLPRFSGDEMGNLLAFLRGDPATAPVAGSSAAPGH